VKLWAIIPVKSLQEGKSRLSGILSDSDRYHLNVELLGNTLRILCQSPAIENVMVVSRDTQVQTIAAGLNVRVLQETPGLDLNAAVTYGVKEAVRQGAQSILILPSDLPLLSATEIDALVEQIPQAPSLTIAPDRRMEGTNALLVSPPSGFSFQFGLNSFQKHVAQSKQKGMNLQIVHSWSLGLDLDLPNDLETLKMIEIDNQ
jgi:2-phospho-L-lactate/phosphoenolpyruvate guanylyltransferase